MDISVFLPSTQTPICLLVSIYPPTNPSTYLPNHLPTDLPNHVSAQPPTFVQESFDPIIDNGTGEDLLPRMVHAESAGDYDFQGMYAILLRYRYVPAPSLFPSSFAPLLVNTLSSPPPPSLSLSLRP